MKEDSLETEMIRLREADVEILRRRVRELERENRELSTELDLANRTLSITLASLHQRTRLLFAQKGAN